MTPSPALFHTLLRPCILQILRATGYHSARSAVLDALTDLAARYLLQLCHMTALYAAHHDAESPEPSIVDVRRALQYMGALLPEKAEGEQDFFGVEDTRGADDFVAWATGPANLEIQRVALDGVEDATDYLGALKQKHGKTEDDSKFAGSLLGRCNEHGGVLVEGGDHPSIQTWIDRMRAVSQRPEIDGRNGAENGAENGDDDSRPASSGLSSVGDRIEEYEDLMDTT